MVPEQDQVWSLGADDRDIGSFVVRWHNATLPGSDWTAALEQKSFS